VFNAIKHYGLDITRAAFTKGEPTSRYVPAFGAHLFLSADTEDVMQVFSPGDHGSTFGGNPLAAAVGLEAIAVLFDDKLIERSAELGAYLLAQLKTVRSSLIRDVRGKGLFIGLEVDARRTDARAVVDRLLARGVISKDTHGTVVRFAPPLVIDRAQIDWAVGEVRAVFAELDKGLRRAA